MELSGRNESKPHLMSLEKFKSGKPSHCIPGEGCHAASSNRQAGAVDSGGVCEGDTTGREAKVSQEISGRGAATPQPPVQGGEPSKAGRAVGEVGVLHSSDDPPESKTGGERREGTRVNAHQTSEGRGWPGNRILTPIKVRELGRRLERTAQAVRGMIPGKPCAGKPPARFDEGRGREAETDNYGLFKSSLPASPTLHCCSGTRPLAESWRRFPNLLCRSASSLRSHCFH